MADPRTTPSGEVGSREETLRALLRAGIAVLLFVLLAFVLSSRRNVELWPYLLMLAGHLVAYGILRAGWLRVAVASHATIYIATVILVMIQFGGLRSPAGLVLPPIVLLVGLTWSGPAAIFTAAACSLGLLAIVVMQGRGLLVSSGSPSSFALWVVATAVLVITSVVLELALRSIARSQARALEAERLRFALEEKLQRAHRLETVARLAAGVAHDFNNLLNVIIGQAGLIARSPDPKVVAAAQRVEDAGWRAADLTKKLLAVGRRQNLQPRDVDLNEVVRGVSPLLRRSLARQQTLDFELAPEVLGLHADSTSLEQILLNLVTNAGDATAEGGEVRIRTGRAAALELAPIPAWKSEAETAVRLEVSDSGIGMSEEVQAHLFEPFFTTKEPGRGTGLGLASVYGIVRQHGGVITVESEAGRGTTFRIYLPSLTVGEPPALGAS